MKAGDKQETEVEVINVDGSITKDKVKYWVHPHHRDNRPDKSQWTILPNEEFRCFVTNWQCQWYKRIEEKGKVLVTHLDKSFGLYLKDNSPQALGKRKAMREGKNDADLFIARFVPDAAHKTWHGYPADGELNDQDIPSSDYLKQWKANGYFTPAKIRKIHKGWSL